MKQLDVVSMYVHTYIHMVFGPTELLSVTTEPRRSFCGSLVKYEVVASL
jgi:hypothetical protein